MAEPLPDDSLADDPRPADRLPDPTRPLRPLATVATGLLLTVLDLTYDGVDVIPDPIGWMVAAVAVGSLRPLHPAFGTAALAGWLGVVLSVPEWFRLQSVLLAVGLTVALIALVVAVCTGILATSPRYRSAAATIRWLSPTTAASAMLLGFAAGGGADAAPGDVGALGGIALVFAVCSGVVILWFLVLLYRAAREAAPADLGSDLT